MEIDFGVLDQAIELALAAGADAAEAYLERSSETTVKVFDLSLERFSSAQNMGLGLRVFVAGRTGRAFSSDLTRASLERASRNAVESARVSPPDPHRFLAPPSLFAGGATGGVELGGELGIWGGDLGDIPAEEKISFALEMEREARDHDRRVRGVETSTYGDSTTEVAIASSEGLRAGYRSSVCYGYLVTIAEDAGDTQTGFGLTAGISLNSLDAADASNEAASMAVDLLSARPVETARVPVLFDNLSAAEMLGALSIALSGEAVVKNKSFLAGKLGECVASSMLQVTDDGLMAGGFGTVPFDGEGVATGRTGLIVGGVLVSYLHNTYTASRSGTESTGNAGRASFKGTVGVSPTNLSIPAGPVDPEGLRSEMGHGFEVLEIQGAHVGLNPVTGELSVGARGMWIEKGRRAYPVREVTIAGTLDDILNGIVGTGSDLRFTPLLGGIGAPSMLVEGLVVSGGTAQAQAPAPPVKKGSTSKGGERCFFTTCSRSTLRGHRTRRR